MSLPKIHSYTWSDDDEESVESLGQDSMTDDPLGLVGKELHLWATYPRKKQKAKRKRRKSAHSKPTLWAAVILKEVRQQNDFSYEVTLKRIYKTGERFIKVVVNNDPQDQSEDSTVFLFLTPSPERLDSLERQLSMWAAQRVYHAIADTWVGVHS